MWPGLSAYSILTQLAKSSSWLLTELANLWCERSLIELHPCQLNGLQGMCSLAVDLDLCRIFFLSVSWWKLASVCIQCSVKMTIQSLSLEHVQKVTCVFVIEELWQTLLYHCLNWLMHLDECLLVCCDSWVKCDEICTVGISAWNVYSSWVDSC